MVNSNDGMKTEASIDYDMDTSEPWMPVISGRLILFCVYYRICGAIANNLSGQYMRYLRKIEIEIEQWWAKWLISDPSPKGTSWINDSMIHL